MKLYMNKWGEPYSYFLVLSEGMRVMKCLDITIPLKPGEKSTVSQVTYDTDTIKSDAKSFPYIGDMDLGQVLAGEIRELENERSTNMGKSHTIHR